MIEKITDFLRVPIVLLKDFIIQLAPKWYLLFFAGISFLLSFLLLRWRRFSGRWLWLPGAIIASLIFLILLFA